MKDKVTQQKTSNPKKLRGTIVSDSMDKTVVVAVIRFFKHSRYRKYVKRTKKYKAHDEKNEYKVGDKVMIEEVRPISKDKHFKILSKV